MKKSKLERKLGKRDKKLIKTVALLCKSARGASLVMLAVTSSFTTFPFFTPMLKTKTFKYLLGIVTVGYTAVRVVRLGSTKH